MKAYRRELINLSDVVDYLVDDCVGIVRYALELKAEAGSPNFFHFYARACDTAALSHQQNSADGGGASTNRDSAMSKAIGEAVERYCSAIFRREDFPLCSFQDANFPCVSPKMFALYSPIQYRRK